MQLALAIPPAIATRARKLRHVCVFDSEAAALFYIERNGDLYVGKPATMRLRPREVDGGWLLCSWWSGYPWALGTDKMVRRVSNADVR